MGANIAKQMRTRAQEPPQAHDTRAGTKRLLDEHTLGAVIGQGRFGVVYACKHRTTGEEVAVKMLDKVEKPIDAIQKEVDLQKSTECTSIVKVREVFQERCFVCIVLEKFDGGTLGEHLQRRGKSNCHDIVHVSRQMATAIQHLHAMNIVHRHVVASNFLMSMPDIRNVNCRIALADFGEATNIKAGERLSTILETDKLYWAPELFRNSYGLKVDIWALGVIVYTLLTSNLPFKEINHIESQEFQMPDDIAEACEDYLKSLLCKDEEQRSSADQALSHMWNTGMCVVLSFVETDAGVIKVINLAGDLVAEVDDVTLDGSTRSHDLLSAKVRDISEIPSFKLIPLENT